MTSNHSLNDDVNECRMLNNELQESLLNVQRLGQALALATAVVCDKAAHLLGAPNICVKTDLKKPVAIDLNVDLGGADPDKVAKAASQTLVQTLAPATGVLDAIGKSYANKVAASGALDALPPFAGEPGFIDVKPASEIKDVVARPADVRPAYAGRAGVIEPGCNRPHVPAAPPSRPTPPAPPPNAGAPGRGGDPKTFFQARRQEEPATALATSRKAFDLIANEIRDRFLRTVRGEVVNAADYIAQLRADAGDSPAKIDDARRALRQAVSATMAKPVASAEMAKSMKPRGARDGSGPSNAVRVLAQLKSGGEQRAQQIATALSITAGDVSERLTRYQHDGFVKKTERRGFWKITPNGEQYLARTV